MHVLKCALAAVTAAGLTAPAMGQAGGYDAAQFVKALEEGKSDEAVKLFKGNPTLANARDFNGQTALLAAIENRDEQWAGYLLQQGADPNVGGPKGDTPLMSASRLGLTDVVDWLLEMGAKVNAGNKRGETALIVAVQNRQVGIVKALIEAGADPDKADSAQGYSARDYAKLNNRTPDLLRAIEAQKPKP